jgi:hypothetical protein
MDGLGVFVPFQFDLGGRIGFSDELLDALREIGPCELSPVKTRSFNISYLARHDPIVRVELAPCSITMVNVRWRVERRLVIYPWLGSVSVGYYFEPQHIECSADDLLHFYDALIAVIDDDYLPYLHEHDQMNLALRRKTDFQPHPPTSPLRLGQTIDRLRSVLEPHIVEPRPELYYFMNFRIMYFWPLDTEPGLDRHVLQALLELRSVRSRHPLPDAAELANDVGKVWSNGWVTVAFTAASYPEDQRTTPVHVLQGTLNLCHAQWFLCQIWISTYLKVLADKERRHWTRNEVHGMAESLYSLERDLSEVTNLDVMLRDPILIQLSRYFHEQLKVPEHLEDAQARLSLLTQYLRGRLDIETSRAAAKLEILFAFSAAAAVAALVDPMWPLWPLHAIGVVVILLLLVLVLVFSPAERWLQSLKRWTPQTQWLRRRVQTERVRPAPSSTPRPRQPMAPVKKT